MSYTMRSTTTMMPRFAYLEFLDNLEQITVIQALPRKTNILLVYFVFFIAIIM
jgi:hypothetical protein